MARNALLRPHARAATAPPIQQADRASAHDLPLDVVVRISGFLPAVDVASMQRVSTRWRAMTAVPAVWTQLLQRDFAQPADVITLHVDRHMLPSSGLMALRDGPAAAGVASAGAVSGAAGGPVQRHPKHEYVAAFVHQIQVFTALRRARPLRDCLDVVEFPLGLGTPCLCVACFLLRECVRAVRAT